MNMEMSRDDLMLVEMLLTKEEGETRVEIHHARSHDYKQFLKEREQHIRDLLERIKTALEPAP